MRDFVSKHREITEEFTIKILHPKQHLAVETMVIIACSSLNDHFPGRWIGRRGSIPWPPRSPDIMLLDFFLWGFVKDNIYRKRLSNIDALKARITTATASVDANMLAASWHEIEYRLHIPRATMGAYMEVY